MIRCIHLWTGDDQQSRSKRGEIIPSYGVCLIKDAAFTRRVRAETAKVLEIESV
jgi:hypothetical protein